MRVESPNWAEVGTRIRSLRKRGGLTQREVAEPVASGSFLSLVESGARRPSPELLDHIAVRLGLDGVEELVTGRSPTAEVELELRLQGARDGLRLGRDAHVGASVREVAEEAGVLELTRLEARCYELLASLEERRDLYEAALGMYERAETLWKNEPAHLRFVTVVGIARCHQSLGDPRLATHLLESYLLELERDGVLDPTATMRVFSTLVVCYSAMGLIEKAAGYADKAQAIAPRVTDAEQIACMNMNVAKSLFDQGRVADSLEAVRLAERAYLSLGWEFEVARAKLNQAILQMDKGDIDAARDNLTEAIETLRRSDQPLEIARALDERGRLERLSGNPAGAEPFLKEAQTYLGNGDFGERALNLRELGLCAQERDRIEAQAYLRRAVDLYVLAGASREAAVTCRLLGDLYMKAGRIEEGAEAYRAGIEAIEMRAQ